MRIFGCIAYALVPSHLRHKLDSKSEKYIFVGYCTESKAYKLYNLVSRKVVVSRDVRFDEEERWRWSSGSEPSVAAILTSVQPDLAQPEASESGSSHSSSSDSMPSSPSSSDSDNSSRSSSSPESTPRKFRSVRELYESCTFALLVADPTY